MNITTVTTAKGPAKQEAVGMFLVEVIRNGVPVTKQGFLERENITGKELTLQLFANAIFIASKEKTEFDSVECYLDEQSVVSAFSNNWISNWKSNEWKTAKGAEIANTDTWKAVCEQIEKLTKRLIVTYSPQSEDPSIFKSSYTNWMGIQCNKRLNDIKEQRMIDAKIQQFKEKMDDV